MAYHPQHPGVPYYTYYNPQQQLYYPYIYSHPYAAPGAPYLASVHHPQTPIDPALLTGPSAAQPQQLNLSSKQPAVPASPSPSSSSDEDDEGQQERFALHPVSYPSPPAATADEEAQDENADEAADEALPESWEQDAKSRPDTSTPPQVAGPSGSSATAVAKRTPGPIGPVTGAPKQDDLGALSNEDIEKFSSPVRTLRHIDLELFPSRAVFENILYTYQSNLSARKRNKALISRAAYAEIQMTLVEIRESRCRRGTAQYRFWVKKMFGLINFYGHDVVGHQGKPVAIREDIYDILVHCHDQCDHGGRDRTVEVVKDFYVGRICSGCQCITLIASA